MLYLVNYYGDIESGKKVWEGPLISWEANGKSFRSLDDALIAIATDFPLAYDERVDEAPHRETPDPEDDRIVVWELDEGKAMKAVWAFCGWHWTLDELNLKEQGWLPGDKHSLYDLARKRFLYGPT